MRSFLWAFLFVFFLFLGRGGFAFGTSPDSTETVPSWLLGGRAHHGFIMPHRRGMRHLVKGHIQSLSLFLERPTTGKKDWHRSYQGANWGVAAVYTDLANPEMLGKAGAIFPYLDFPLIIGERASLAFRTGTGFGWVQKPFDRLENPKNIAIGSRSNITFSFMLHGKFDLPGRWGASAGLSFDHFSNMAVRMPNLGINLPSTHLGIHRGLGEGREVREGVKSEEKDPLEERVGDLRGSLIASGGVKGVPPPDGRLYPAFTVMGLFGERVSAKSMVGGGLDLEWNGSLREVIAEKGEDASDLPLTHEGRVGLKAGYALVIDRLRLIGQWGVYIQNAYEKEGPFYHRFGVRYDLGRWLINGTLKTHFAKADHFEFGLGYRFGDR